MTVNDLLCPSYKRGSSDIKLEIAMTDTNIPDVPAQSIHPETARYHYLDNLRALAMTLGVLFHAAIAYMPVAHETWAVANAKNSLGLEAVAYFAHLFRMPLFMFVAGFFGHFLLMRRGTKGFIKNRSVRVLAPLVIFLPLMLSAIIGVIIYAAYTAENRPPMLMFIVNNYQNPEAMQAPFSTMHLWFLFNLLLFYISALLLIKIIPFSFNKWLASWSPVTIKIALLLVLPLLLIPALYVQITPPTLAPDRIYPQLWSFGFYGIYFALGWLFFTNRNLLNGLERYWLALLAVSLVAFAVAFSFYPRSLSIELMLNQETYVVEPLKQILLATLHGFVSVYMVLVCLVLGRKHLNSHNKVFRYFADSSYWIYLVHPPILLYIQVFLLDTEWNMWLEFLVSSSVTLAISLLSYQVLVRYTPIGWMLNGRKNKSRNL
jgi:glucan biosynthesis protein C